MKRIFNILSVAVLVLASASCDRKVEFQHETFATFRTVNYNLNETAGSVTVPVMIYNPTGAETQVSVSVIPGKAVEGTDFEIVSPANGILTFSGATDSLAVEIAISDDFVGEFTGAKDFKLQLASVTDGVSVGNFDIASFTIIDLDHPLSAFIGTWTGTMGGMYQYASYNTSFNVIADENDETYTKLIFSTGIDPFFHGMGLSTATYAAEAISATEVVVIAEQPNGYQDVILLGFNAPDPDAATAYDHLYFTLQDDGTLKQENAYGAYTPGQGGFYEIYPGGAVFSKQ